MEWVKNQAGTVGLIFLCLNILIQKSSGGADEEIDRFYSVLDGSRDDHKVSAAYTVVYPIDGGGVCGVRL